MTNMEILNEPVDVIASMDAEGYFRPQSLTWRRKKFSIVSVGRQWDEEQGRGVLVEAADGTRFELLLRREDLSWRIKKIWWGQIVA